MKNRCVNCQKKLENTITRYKKYGNFCKTCAGKVAKAVNIL